MAATTRRTARKRTPLSRERVLHAAIALADERGAQELTMRKLAKELGVEAMSLYNHVANKTALLDGMVDIVFSEIDPPTAGGDWKAELRKRAVSTRTALNRHRWAIGEMEGRSNHGPSNLRVHDAVLGCLRGAGFSFGHLGPRVLRLEIAVTAAVALMKAKRGLMYSYKFALKYF